MTDSTDLATPPKGSSGKRLGFVVAAVALVALLALLATGMTRDPRELPSALIGKPLPAFSLPGMKRADPPLTQADLLGKTRVINVWASWCVACQSEHPVLMTWQRELVAQGRGHTLYGVNYDSLQGRFELLCPGAAAPRQLLPEKRSYPGSQMPMTESAIVWGVTRDLYVAMADMVGTTPKGPWMVRLQVKPFIRWVWGGTVLMALGALTASFARRYRRKVAHD